MKSVVALIDGDVLAFHACPYDRSKISSQVGTPAVNMEGEVIYNAKGDPEIEYSQSEDEAFLEICWRNFRNSIKSTMEEAGADAFKMAVKGEGNFRDLIHDDYKGHRSKSGTNRNIFVPVLRDMAVDAGLAIAATGMEADDLLRIWATEIEEEDVEEFVICSIDKDLRCIPGRHFHMKTKKTDMVTEDDAHRLFYAQLLSGDPVDKIPGLPGVGPVKAVNAIAAGENESDYQFIVKDAYQEEYGDGWRVVTSVERYIREKEGHPVSAGAVPLAKYESWEDMLLFNGRLLYLLKTYDDFFNLHGWVVTDFEETLKTGE